MPRKAPFKRNAIYEVTQDCGLTAPRALFRQGQRVRYQRYIGHSPYDAAAVYGFVDVDSGEIHEFWWFDSDDEAYCHARLKLISSP